MAVVVLVVVVVVAMVAVSHVAREQVIDKNSEDGRSSLK